MPSIKEITDALSYIRYCIKEGHAEQDDFVGMSNKELVKWADDTAGRADARADQEMEAKAEAAFGGKNG